MACGASFLVGTLLWALTESWRLFLFGRALQAVVFAMAAGLNLR